MLTGTSEKKKILVMVIREAAHPLNWQIKGSVMATKVSGLTSCGKKKILLRLFLLNMRYSVV
jgi:hypothetical protein